jgi:transcriptional regulator with XRE-family HTH domain
MSDTLPATAATDASFGALLRGWRQHRRLSQLELSLATGVSTRHLSFLETGRSQPSRQMVLTLAEHLRVPLRERNPLLTAAGFAPLFARRPLDAPELEPVQWAVARILEGHEPYPAVVVDRVWNVVSMNRAASLLATDVDADLLAPVPNVYRLSLHPGGLAPRIANLAEFAAHLLRQLRHDAEVSADPDLAALLGEVESYPDIRSLPRTAVPKAGHVVVPMRLRHPAGELALFTAITTFGTPVDVTVAELALELFFPADAVTASRLRRLGDGPDVEARDHRG